MKKLLFSLALLFCTPAFAQIPGGSGLQIGATPISGGVNGDCLTVNGLLLGQTTCGGASDITVGTTTISGGSSGRLVYDNAGVVGELATTGTGNVVLANSPTLVTPNIGAATGTSFVASGILTAGSLFAINWSGRGILTSPGTQQIQLGANNSASPLSQTLLSQGARGGTDTNTAGSNLTILSGLGTGTGTPSMLILQAPVVAASGTTQQTSTTALTITGTKVTVASGLQFQLGNSATTGLTPGALAALTTATLTFTDSTGTVYRVPAITP